MSVATYATTPPAETTFDVDIKYNPDSQPYDPVAPRLFDLSVEDILDGTLNKERRQLERRHALVTDQLDELEAWWNQVKDRCEQTQKRLRSEIRTLSQRKNSVAPADDQQQHINDRLQHLYKQLQTERQRLQKWRHRFLEEKRAIESERVAVIEDLEDLHESERVMDETLDTDLADDPYW